MPSNIAIFWPMVVQAALTLALYPILMFRRKSAATRGDASFMQMANGGVQPEAAGRASRNLMNQYELPVLFFAVCLALYVTNGASWFAFVIAWIFVISRVAHAIIHVGMNVLQLRGAAFGLGYLCIVILWIMFAIHILNVGAVLSGPLPA